MIPFGGEYTRKQWGRGIRLAMYPTGRGLVLRMLAAALVLGGIAIIGVSYLQGETLNASRLLRIAISLTFLGSWAALPYFRAWRVVTQPWRTSSGHPSLQGVVTSAGITSNAAGGGALEKWDIFLRAHVCEDTVVLVSTDGLATVLPREFFATEDHWRGFRQFVEFNVVAPS